MKDEMIERKYIDKVIILLQSLSDSNNHGSYI